MEEDVDANTCAIPSIYCGEGPMPQGIQSDPPGSFFKYTRRGKSYECLQKGFGAGSSKEKKKHIATSSLQHIKYIGEKHEASLKRVGIKTLSDLERLSGSTTFSAKLKSGLKSAGGVIDKRAYNSVVMYLSYRGKSPATRCYKLK